MFGKLIGYLRGFVCALLHFERPALVCKRGKLRVIRNWGRISVGERTNLWPEVKLSCVGGPERQATLVIGRDCSIGDRSEIHCGGNVVIGDRVIIAWDCIILDRDYHAVNGGEEQIAPVRIESDVWIGCRAIILKGVTIGERSVVGAGSVVTKNVPASCVVAGNPAKVIGPAKGWRNV